MRLVTSITVLAAAAGAAWLGGLADLEGLSDRVSTLPFSRSATAAEVAVEVRCGALVSWQRRTCEEDLTQRFAAGSADPEAVLRLHCTRTRNVWEQQMPTPPPLCAARFGGWIDPQPRALPGRAA